MAHVKINGIAVNCLASGSETLRIGEITTSFGGARRRSVRTLRDSYPFTTALYAVSTSRALRAWIEGRGHVLSFDSTTTTSRGLAVGSVSGTLTVTASGKYGSYGKYSSGGSSSWAVLPAATTWPWSALLWRNESGTWHHYLVISTSGSHTGAAVYKNGVTSVATPGDFIRRSTTSLSLGDHASGGFTDFDDAVLLDFAVPSAWAADLYTFHNTQAWPSLPSLLAEGDRLLSGGQTVLGEPGATGSMEFRESSTWTLGEAFDFTLTETA